MKSFISLLLLCITVFVLSACDELDVSLQADRYVVTFETNSAMTLHPLEFTEGDSITLPVLTMVDDAVFQGWYLDPEFTQAADDLSAIREDFTVYARWQEASYEMLVDVYRPVDVTQLFMNNSATFYLDDAGTVYTQLNPSSAFVRALGWNTMSTIEPLDLAQDRDVRIYSWGNNAYLLTSHGEVYAWGDNRYGQLGDGRDASSAVFIDISERFALDEDETIIKLVGNAISTFALTSHGHVYAWGSNEHNLISPAEHGTVSEPRDTIQHLCGVTDHFLHDSGVCGDTDNIIVDLAVMERHVIYLTRFGDVLVIGENVSSWFDRVEIQGGNIREAVSAELRGHIVDMQASLNTLVLVSETNQLLVLGDSQLARHQSRLSIGDFLDPDDDGDNIPDLFGVHLAGDTLLVHLTNDTLWGLGDNQTQLITGKRGAYDVRRPAKLELSFTPTQIITSPEGACAADDEGSLWCWGQGSSRSVGSDDKTILHSTYRYVTYRGEETEWQGTEEKPNEVEASYALMFNPVHVVNSPPVARQQQLYTVTRYHVSSVPQTIGYQGRLNAKAVVDTLCALEHNDCNDEDPTVYPGAFEVYERSNGVIRWMFEVGFERIQSPAHSERDSRN